MLIFYDSSSFSGQLTIKIEVYDIRPINYNGVFLNLPENIDKKITAHIFNEMSQTPLYKLKTQIEAQFLPDAKFPKGLIIEELRPAFGDIIISIEGNPAGVQWLGDSLSISAFAAAIEHLFVTETLLAHFNISYVSLKASVDPDDVEAVIREYNSGLGFAEQPTIGDLKLWVEIEMYHLEKIRKHLQWARETETWLESSLGSFLMTCKQVLPNGEPLTDAAHLERRASQSSRASVDKTGMTSFANAFRRIVAVTQDLANELALRFEHTHRFEKKYPHLFETRTKILDLIVQMQKKYSGIMDVGACSPVLEAYEGWRAKLLAKEADLYLPIVSIIPFFKEHVLEVDVLLDEFKVQLLQAFPNECRILTELAQTISQKQSVENAPTKTSKAAVKPTTTF